MTPFGLALVHDEGLDPSLPALERHAVRAVVLRGAEVLLLRDLTGAWKFPGGGVRDDPHPVFVHVSRYYRCRTVPGSGTTALSAGERALGLAAGWVRLDRAVRDNRARVDGPRRFVRRELLVRERLAAAAG